MHPGHQIQLQCEDKVTVVLQYRALSGCACSAVYVLLPSALPLILLQMHPLFPMLLCAPSVRASVPSVSTANNRKVQSILTNPSGIFKKLVKTLQVGKMELE